MTRFAVLAAVLASACEGTSGTVTVGLTTAPGSTVLDPVTRLHLTLTDPHREVDAARNANGSFSLSLALDVEGQVGSLVLEGFDTSDTLVATGASPPFALGPTDAHIVIYVAAPLSIAPAPVALAPVRSGVVGVAQPYGVLFAGGRDAQGAPTDAVAAYNAYDHSLTGGMPMPDKRAEFAIGANDTGAIYLIGGVDAAGAPVPRVLRFDTTIRPSGAYLSLGDMPAFARAGEIAVKTASDRFLVTGSPPGELAGNALAPRTEVAALPAVGESVVGTDGLRTAVFVGDAGLIRFRDDRFDTLGGTGRVRASITALPDRRLVIAGGGTATVPVRDVLIIDPASGALEPHVNALATARFSPAIAATDRYLVVAGGTDAADVPIANAEVFDVTTLAPLATLPIGPRAHAIAFPLPNGQILIAGGSPATDLLELFTPPPE